jgi:hypothetical protein
MDVSVLMVESPGLRQVESDGIEERSPHFRSDFRNSFSNVLVTYPIMEVHKKAAIS